MIFAKINPNVGQIYSKIISVALIVIITMIVLVVEDRMSKIECRRSNVEDRMSKIEVK
ncbi:hypothetical protein FRACYDRAFT_229552 [Fragilariopsis cylindrus CCMP1102]|uniref:Uncharacterized protein n=1 Tax=Fragilariopsis cylindrus CCMP1102 TaxID=635003 RepID=A0A1E7EN70_9STRA|nr:hypothetical protein FRACYDRAFT_229552 [Fragilariopsis cylindrus CCMP1102]|eukprot:OEU07399.1 hypothetical protein FRACYDRAFT_229552 [Fragilariopsis cylindrus CCMP1102]